jgi:Nif-specific regulatory protein
LFVEVPLPKPIATTTWSSFELDALLDWSTLYEAANRHPAAAAFLPLGLGCLGRLSAASSPAASTTFWEHHPVAQEICRTFVGRVPGLRDVRWVRGQKGIWRCLAAASEGAASGVAASGGAAGGADVAGEWLAQALDSGESAHRFPLSAVPLRGVSRRDQLFVLEWNDPPSAEAWWPHAAAWTAALESVLAVASMVVGSQQAAQHLLALLELTAQWNRSVDTPSLLRQIAETSTEWIPAQRATIFLWDRPNKVLIGRPALGVEGTPLRLPDDAGLVGQVVQSGLAGRVDEDVACEQAQVDRRTDRQLNFQTRTLLCVPLWDDAGRCIGAFELINRRQGNFDDADQRSLELLAKHAAIALSNLNRVERLVTTQKTAAAEAAAAVQLRGSCPLVVTLRQSLHRVAATDLTVLLLGENGTGKEVAAQMLHYESPRRHEVLIAVNCAAIPDTLLESELFGHEKGAFTDAVESRAGKFELANQGTIFLDEIGDLSPSGQAKLLRVLEEKAIVRVGGSQTLTTNARVVAATNQNLAELVRQRKFREDLFFRLNVVTLEIPPLRLRGDDVIELAEYFLASFCKQARRSVPRLAAATEQLLRRHPWPGNVRELRNMMERVAFLSTADVVEPSELSFISLAGQPSDPRAPATDLNLSLNDATKTFQMDYIHRQIDKAAGNMSLAAQALGLHRTNLYRKMKQLGMEVLP